MDHWFRGATAVEVVTTRTPGLVIFGQPLGEQE